MLSGTQLYPEGRLPPNIYAELSNNISMALIASGQTTSALLNAASSAGGKKRKKEDGRGSSSSSPPFPASHYALSLTQMEALGYPMPALDKASGLMKAPEGYVASPGGGLV